MGKKEKNKKKGKGAEKTAEKTQKKMKLKIKKATGEDDIESIVKAIEEEERKRQEVKEIKVDPPSHRSNFSLTAHPEHPELIFFGGEFYSGNKTKMYNDLFIYNTKRKDWTQIKSPAGPPPRSSHQAIILLNLVDNCGFLAENSQVQVNHNFITTEICGFFISLPNVGKKLYQLLELLRPPEVVTEWSF